MANKLTKKDLFGEIRKIVEGMDRTDLVEFVDHELELLNRKSSKSGNAKKQAENDGIKANIIKALTKIATPVTITELQAKSEEMAQYSNQKLSALLKQLVDTNQVTKIVDKKKSMFTVAE